MKELAIIQQKLNAPKDKNNNFANFKYRSAEGILAAVKPLLAETGTFLTLTDDIVELGGRFYIKATATLSTIDGKQSVSTTAFAREADKKAGNDVAQITGGCSSYSRKYALCGLFAIDDSSKDPDTMDNSGVKEAIDDLHCSSTDRKTFEQAMKRHKEFMTNDDFRKACAELSKKYPKP